MTTAARRMPPPRPWYREPWPWILMGLPLAAVLASIATAWIAIVNDDPLVVDNYYKEGLAINRTLDRERVAAEAGYRADVMVSQDGSRVRVYLAGGRAPDSIRLRFVHPTRAEHDRAVELKGRQTGWYEGPLGLSSAQRWRIDLEDGARTWRLTGAWRPADDSPARLAPGG
jgi:hypothetical protein